MKRADISFSYVIFGGMFSFVFLTAISFSNAQIPFSTQPEKTQTRSGNSQYQNQNFTEAEASYKKALDIKNNMPEATFNLGDAVYEQKRYEDAQKQFQLSAKTNADPSVKAKAYHNLGNSFLSQKKWEDAIQAYKNSLKINPNDAETKYNLAYANAMLKKNSGGNQDNKDKNQQDQKDKKDQQDQQNQKDQQQQQKDQKNQDGQDKDQQQQKDQQANNQDQKKQQQQQGQKPRLSKEEAEQLLAALQNEEQKTNQKMQKKQMKAVTVTTKKDW